jgi:predicted transposase YbfD/YdcC
LHPVSAWASEYSLTLGQIATEEKPNETTATPELLELLDLKGALVSIGAMGRQKQVAGQVVEQGGDYALTVKDNQPDLAADILSSFTAAQEVDYEGHGHDRYETSQRGHGRQEKRSYTVLYDLDKIRGRDEWERLTVVGLCHSERTVAARPPTSCGCSSAAAEPARGHWGIENGQHWSLDVSFREDDSRIQKRDGGTNSALLRKIALSLLKRHPSKDSINRKRYAAALGSSFLEEIINSADKLGDV